MNFKLITEVSKGEKLQSCHVLLFKLNTGDRGWLETFVSYMNDINADRQSKFWVLKRHLLLQYYKINALKQT